MLSIVVQMVELLIAGILLAAFLAHLLINNPAMFPYDDEDDWTPPDGGEELAA